MILDSYQN